MIGALVTSTLATAEAVDANEAGGSERCEETAANSSPEGPAEVRVVLVGRHGGTVLAARETTKRRHGRRLQHDYRTYQHFIVTKRLMCSSRHREAVFCRLGLTSSSTFAPPKRLELKTYDFDNFVGRPP